MSDFEIKIFSPEHISEAAEIERLCFSEPWSEDALLYMCTAPITHAVAVIERSSGRLAAYGGCEYVLDEANIVNVATHPDFRRRGCAEALLGKMEEFLSERGVADVYLEVRVSNTPARTLYEKLGFRAVGVRKKYYRLPVEDAVVMKKTLDKGEN
jgi:ribosomal-protein-alanine N-acetyltransferase